MAEPLLVTPDLIRGPLDRRRGTGTRIKSGMTKVSKQKFPTPRPLLARCQFGEAIADFEPDHRAVVGAAHRVPHGALHPVPLNEHRPDLRVRAVARDGTQPRRDDVHYEIQTRVVSG